MSVQVEKNDNNTAVMTIEIPVGDVEKAIDKVYARQKGRISLPGFRKGKAPRKMVEKYYGANVFMEDAINDLLPESYDAACLESGLDITSAPEIEYVQAEHGKPVIYKATVALRPPVELGQYKGLEVDIKPADVTEEDVMEKIREQQLKNSTTKTVDDRPVKDGDMIELDFDGYTDGEPFDGGKAENYALTVGSGTFIKGFEEQLVGASIGEPVDVNVTFPEDYSAKDLAGKDALFKCVVKSIKERTLPELDDEFASEVSEFETLDAYKAGLREELAKDKKAAAQKATEEYLVDKVIEGSTIQIPELMLRTEQQSIVRDFEQQLKLQGVGIRQYMEYTGLSEDQVLAQTKDNAQKRIKSRLCLEEIANRENISVTEDDMEKEYVRMAEAYGMDVDRLKGLLDDSRKKELKENLRNNKAIDFLVESAQNA